jgi:hypothetical protein
LDNLERKKIPYKNTIFKVIQTLNSSNGGSVVGWRFVREIRRLLALDGEIKVSHSYYE